MQDQWVIALSELKKALKSNLIQPERLEQLAQYVDVLKVHLTRLVGLFAQVHQKIDRENDKDNHIRGVNIISKKLNSLSSLMQGKSERSLAGIFVQLNLSANNLILIACADNLKGLTTETRRLADENNHSYKIKLASRREPLNRLRLLPRDMMMHVFSDLPSESLASLASASKHFASMFDEQAEKGDNLWVHKLQQLGISPLILDIFERMFKKHELVVDYRSLALRVERVLTR